MESGIEIRRALIGMPGYGQITPGASRGLWRATARDAAKIPIDADVVYAGGSLLARNFNYLWCEALNRCLKGDPVHYFAMLHDDIEPEDGWLDVLIEEMEAKGLDVLGAVSPIKDPLGITSIALERPDGDTWEPLCRLTMREVFRLPETFTSEDVGHKLLLNTGCWVMRFDIEIAKKLFFTINDRIIFDRSAGRYVVQTESEDWFFSRLCHERGLKVGATRKVRLAHVGTMRFPNTEPWGQARFDPMFVKESVLPVTPTPDGFTFPDEVDGWLLPSEGAALFELARGKRVLEIGSYCGRSTICLAQSAEIVYSVDPHDGRGTPNPRDTRYEMARNLIDREIRNVMQMVGTADTLAPKLADTQPFDLIFIDGDHSYDAVKNDIAHALKLLKPGGLLAFHDYRERPGQHDGNWDAGVTQAVNELIAAGGELLSTHSTVAVVNPPSP